MLYPSNLRGTCFRVVHPSETGRARSISSSMEITAVKPILLLTAMVISLFVVTLVQERASTPQQFRGILRCPRFNIGGEGSDLKLVTKSKAFDLLLSRELRRDLNLHGLNGKFVIVVGFSFTARGIERRPFNAIKVISITAANP
jgi:hypothetical protein